MLLLKITIPQNNLNIKEFFLKVLSENNNTIQNHIYP